MTILSDYEITCLALENGMIDPFTPKLIRERKAPILSYGLSSYGYDLRLSAEDFRIFRHIPGTVIDPKKFNPANLESVPLNEDESGKYFILPGHTYALGFALERLKMPENITGICIGKSTYARAGIIANLTPIEAGWLGNLTLELSNSSRADCKIYANEGICQVLFYRGEPCQVSYADRKGKYQGQAAEVTLARV